MKICIIFFRKHLLHKHICLSLLRRGSLGEGAGKKRGEKGARGTTGRRKSSPQSSRNQSYGKLKQKKPLRRREHLSKKVSILVLSYGGSTCPCQHLKIHEIRGKRNLILQRVCKPNKVSIRTFPDGFFLFQMNFSS